MQICEISGAKTFEIFTGFCTRIFGAGAKTCENFTCFCTRCGAADGAADGAANGAANGAAQGKELGQAVGSTWARRIKANWLEQA